MVKWVGVAIFLGGVLLAGHGSGGDASKMLPVTPLEWVELFGGMAVGLAILWFTFVPRAMKR
jgi:hypothetical protein